MMLKKFLLATILLFWLGLSIVDWYGNFIIAEADNPVFWRAWEVASNYTPRPGDQAPFKPLFRYEGRLEGDLLNAANLQPRDFSRTQLFQVDEYGYRNEPGFLDKPIDAVVLGTSFVVGAALDQDELVSTILTEKYGIRTYNFNQTVQAVLEDERFDDNPPEYVIFVGSEGEVYTSNWWYTVVNREPIFSVAKWDSYDTWLADNQAGVQQTYQSYSTKLRNYSLVRTLVNTQYRNLLNYNRDWYDLVQTNTQEMVKYDLESDMLFFQPDYDNPLLGSTGKTTEDLETAVTILNQTQAKLAEEGKDLVVVAVPSKTNSELRKYVTAPENSKAIVYYNQLAAEKAEYIAVDVYSSLYQKIQDPKQHLYFADDSHWTEQTNQTIAREVAKKICPNFSDEHRCHQALANTSN